MYSPMYSPLELSKYSPLLYFTVVYISITLPRKFLLFPVPLKKGETC